MFSHVPVHFAILWGFSICLGGGGAGGGDAARLCFFAAGFFGGAAGTRSSVAPLEMFVMRNAGAFLAAGLREGHCGGAPPPLLPPYMLAQLSKLKFAHHSLPSAAMASTANGSLLQQLVLHIYRILICQAVYCMWLKTGVARHLLLMLLVSYSASYDLKTRREIREQLRVRKD